MKLEEKDIQKIIRFVKEEPRTVQEISKIIGRAWVTTDSYLNQLKERTGLIGIKTFRKGSQGALKIVYYDSKESMVSDDVKDRLFNEIRTGKKGSDFDFMELFQFIDDDKKRSEIEKYGEGGYETEKYQNMIDMWESAERMIYSFAGEDFINRKKGEKSMLDVIEGLLKRKVMVKILFPLNVRTIENISKLSGLLSKYPEFLEVRHCYQPLRGFIIDDKYCRFKDEQELKSVSKKDFARIYYNIYDVSWIEWFQKVFWNLYRSSLDFNSRIKEIKKII